jgi:hypothetical protein
MLFFDIVMKVNSMTHFHNACHDTENKDFAHSFECNLTVALY